MTLSALIVPLYFRYCTIVLHILCNTTLLAMETAVHAAFVITEPHLTFNWPLKHTGEMELHREGVKVSSDPILVTLTCLPVNHTPLPYTSLTNQPYEVLHSGSHCSPHLQGPRRFARTAELYVLVCPRHQSLPMSNDRPVAGFELRIRLPLKWNWKEVD